MKFRSFLLSAISIPATMPCTALAAAQAGSGADADIVVTASALDLKVDETATPVVTLSGDDLVHRRQATLGDTYVLNEHPEALERLNLHSASPRANVSSY